MISIKPFFAIMMALTCTSCSTTRPIEVAYNCPPIELPANPKLPPALTETSPPNDVVKWWVATAEGYRSWNKAVRIQVYDSV